MAFQVLLPLLLGMGAAAGMGAGISALQQHHIRKTREEQAPLLRQLFQTGTMGPLDTTQPAQTPAAAGTTAPTAQTPGGGYVMAGQAVARQQAKPQQQTTTPRRMTPAQPQRAAQAPIQQPQPQETSPFPDPHVVPPLERPFLPQTTFDANGLLKSIKMVPNPAYMEQQEKIRQADFADRVDKTTKLLQSAGMPLETAIREAYFKTVEDMDMVDDNWLDVLELDEAEKDALFVDAYLKMKLAPGVAKDVQEIDPSARGDYQERLKEVVAANRVAYALGHYPKEFEWAINTGPMAMPQDYETAAGELGLSPYNPATIGVVRDYLENRRITEEARTAYKTTEARLDAEWNDRIGRPLEPQVLEQFGLPAGTTLNDLLQAQLIPTSGDPQEMWIRQALSMMNVMESVAKNLFTEEGINRFESGADLKIQRFLQSNPDLAAWESMRLALAVAMARAAGERGMLSRMDIQPHLDAVPGVWTSKTFAAGYFLTQRRVLNDKLEIARKRSTSPAERDKLDRQRAFEDQLNKDPNIGWGGWNKDDRGYYLIDRANNTKSYITPEGGD